LKKTLSEFIQNIPKYSYSSSQCTGMYKHTKCTKTFTTKYNNSAEQKNTDEPEKQN